MGCPGSADFEKNSGVYGGPCRARFVELLFQNIVLKKDFG